ncbi:hypothetical protein KY359_03950 [Candidatus Woesearchaeota archaeon]|nr:hypothetical protein [Candidatus Woesearchaeota archaeon]
MIPWLMISVGVLLLLLGILVFVLRYGKKGKHLPPTDYYSMFVMGIIWLAFGAAGMMFYGNDTFFFLVMGVVFALIGLAHKKDWKKNHRTWNQLTKEEQKFKTIVIIALGALLLIGVVALLIVQMAV